MALTIGVGIFIGRSRGRKGSSPTAHTLTYHVEGGVPESISETYDPGTVVTLKSPEELNITLPEGYTFNGWEIGGEIVTEVTMDRNKTVIAELAEEPNDFIEIGGLLWAKHNLIVEDRQYFNFDEAQLGASAIGARCPTTDEFQALINLGSTWDTELKGRWFGEDNTLKSESVNSIFLPAMGRKSGTGSATNVGTLGYYWSGTADATDDRYGFEAHFNASGVSNGNMYARSYGLSVRCVKDK